MGKGEKKRKIKRKKRKKQKEGIGNKSGKQISQTKFHRSGLYYEMELP